MKKIVLLAGVLLSLASSAWADTYVTVPHPSAVWDSTTHTAYKLCAPGSASSCTVLPTLGIANTWTGTQTFSGVANFTSTFQVGGTAETFPASGLLVGTTDTQTLSGKTLTAPIINNPVTSGPVPVACGATCTVGAANDITLLNQAAGSVATLPGATGTGIVHRFRISVITTSAAEKILTNPITDTIIGTAIGENAGTAKVFVGNASTYHSIQMPFAGSQPSGGFVGDQVTCTDIATGVWACDINYQAGTTPTTPYSASTT